MNYRAQVIAGLCLTVHLLAPVPCHANDSPDYDAVRLPDCETILWVNIFSWDEPYEPQVHGAELRGGEWSTERWS